MNKGDTSFQLTKYQYFENDSEKFAYKFAILDIEKL